MPIRSYNIIFDHIPYCVYYIHMTFILYFLTPLTYFTHPLSSGNHAFILSIYVYSFCFVGSTCKWDYMVFVCLTYYTQYTLDQFKVLQIVRFNFLWLSNIQLCMCIHLIDVPLTSIYLSRYTDWLMLKGVLPCVFFQELNLNFSYILTSFL